MMDLCELWHNHPTPVLAISRKDGSATVVRVLVWLVLVCLGKRARSAPRSVLVLVLLVLVCLCAHGFVTADCEKACSAPRQEGPAEGPYPTCIAPKRAQGV